MMKTNYRLVRNQPRAIADAVNGYPGTEPYVAHPVAGRLNGSEHDSDEK